MTRSKAKIATIVTILEIVVDMAKKMVVEISRYCRGRALYGIGGDKYDLINQVGLWLEMSIQ